MDRLLAIIVQLQSRRVTRAEELAERFNVSIRTIYRDMTALGEAGIPIVAEAGLGYALMKGFFLPPVSFSQDEASALAAGMMLLRQYSEHQLERHMDAALAKIRSVLPPERRESLQALESAMAPVAVSSPPLAVSLTSMQLSLCSRSVVRIEYRAAGSLEPVRRDVEPVGLVFYLDRWHMIAWCRLRQDYRDFRVDRIAAAEVLKDTFPPRTGFSLPEFLRRYLEPVQTQAASVCFSIPAADRARRDWGCYIREERPSGEEVQITFAVDDLRWLAAWLLSLGPEASIVSPPMLRQLVIEGARNALAHHSGVKAAAS